MEEKVIKVAVSPVEEYINTEVPKNGILQDRTKLPRKVDDLRVPSRQVSTGAPKYRSEQQDALQGGWGGEKN